MRVGLEKGGWGGVGSGRAELGGGRSGVGSFFNSNACAEVNTIRSSFVIEHFFNQLSTTQLLSSNSLLLKKLNSNSKTPCERVQNFIYLF